MKKEKEKVMIIKQNKYINVKNKQNFKILQSSKMP